MFFYVTKKNNTHLRAIQIIVVARMFLCSLLECISIPMSYCVAHVSKINGFAQRVAKAI